ncbi:DASS family sodium-coupled anion symporter [Balneolaceae bacterium YR4-1]|uniref:DASS family sodium-coupled anion symporter n=1 Tax=Halalkalibaculum roseum TaxID=2709311 RepID=A0A6M1SRN5_9BACT|nr:DASS family sodium-coupled anion symporter [Halalkalibaculum roseum]NGP75480.1 DASS family sodium-coupled anion symporter [Halalkalibaculum roseum]
MSKNTFTGREIIGFLTGLLLFIVLMVLPAPEGLSEAAWRTAAVALMMGTWWITEAIPIAATALVPVVLFPFLGISNIDSTLEPYAHPLIFLFMGGFIIAIAMEKWELHRRIALNIVSFVGTRPHAIVLGFILASAFLSMWVSNTATALMMLPIALSVIRLVDRQQEDSGLQFRHFGLCLLLGVAYGCNVGGMGTLIGTPPNALLAGFMADNYGIEISFARWLLFGLPLVVICIPIVYLVLTRLVYPLQMEQLPGGSQLFEEALQALGSISKPEKKIALVFTLTALLWITRPLFEELLPGVSDTGIAMAAALSFFLIPVKSEETKCILEWNDVEGLPWGVLILFGGGLSLASAINNTGLAEWIGLSLQGLASWPVLVLLFLLVAMIIFLTEMTSNTATAAAFLPIMGSVAVGIGLDPMLFALPVALAASSAFMLPVATPPNAIIYGSNRITIPEMAKAGLWLNLIFIVLLSLTAYTVGPYIFAM